MSATERYWVREETEELNKHPFDSGDKLDSIYRKRVELLTQQALTPTHTIEKRNMVDYVTEVIEKWRQKLERYW